MKKIIFILLIAMPLLAETAPSPVPTAKNELFKADFNGEPTYITSDSLSLNASDRKFVYTGNVQVKQKEMLLNAATMEGYYDENNQIQTLVAKTNVVITQGPDLKAKSQRATYNQSNSTMVLTENPELEQKGSILTADKIIIYIDENRSEAVGTVQVKLVEEKVS